MSSQENIDLSNISDETTVEEYLKMQCDKQIERLKKHSEDLVTQFEKESAEVREKLVQRLGSPTNP